MPRIRFKSAAQLRRWQLKALRNERARALASARFVRRHGLDTPDAYVTQAWRAHTALMAMLRSAG